MTDFHELAKRIATELFTNGAGQQAHRLVLTSDQGRDLGGWGRRPVEEIVYRILAEQPPSAAPNRTPPLDAVGPPTSDTSGGFTRGKISSSS